MYAYHAVEVYEVVKYLFVFVLCPGVILDLYMYRTPMWCFWTYNLIIGEALLVCDVHSSWLVQLSLVPRPSLSQFLCP